MGLRFDSPLARAGPARPVQHVRSRSRPPRRRDAARPEPLPRSRGRFWRPGQPARCEVVPVLTGTTSHRADRMPPWQGSTWDARAPGDTRDTRYRPRKQPPDETKPVRQHGRWKLPIAPSAHWARARAEPKTPAAPMSTGADGAGDTRGTYDHGCGRARRPRGTHDHGTALSFGAGLRIEFKFDSWYGG